MPLIQEITKSDRLSIGDVSVFYEWYDRDERLVMLIVSDPSKPFAYRSKPHFLKGGGVVCLPNGAFVALQHGYTQKRAKLGIINPEQLPVKREKQTWALAQAAQKAQSAQPPAEPEFGPTRCDTPGCFSTAYGGHLCNECLDSRTPLERGPVQVRELMYSRQYGGEDLAATQKRLRRRGQLDGMQ